MKIEDIARVAHEANRAYCVSLGDQSQEGWDESPGWQRDGVIAGVQFLLDRPLASARDAHDAWIRHKQGEGWVYGEAKDPEAKTHPCLRPFVDLPTDHQVKDYMFVAIIRTLLRYNTIDPE